MAELINLAGTTSHSFTIGEDGVTTYHGKGTPLIEIGKPGDIYIQDTTEIIEGGQDTGRFRPYGKVFMKLVVEGETKWEPIKNYSFDTPIITHEETEEKSNLYKISLKQADNDTATVVTSTKANDYEKNHDDFGVTRYATDTEVIPSSADVTTFLDNYKTYDTTAANFPKIYDNYSPDKFIAETPNQVASNIEIEMKRALKTEGKLNSLTTRTKNDLVSAINELDGDLGTVSSAMTAGTALGGKTISTGNNTDVSAATAISTLNTKAGVLTSLTTDEKNTLVGAINEVDAHTDTNTQNIGTITTPMATGTALAGKTIATGNNTDITVANAISTLNTAVKTNKDNIGDLTALTTEDKSNLVAAVNSEVTRATNAEGNLQDQIDAITSKSDVADIVPDYASLTTYDASPLYDNDVIKVLEDETDNNATTYYRLSPVPTTPDVTVGTKSALPAVSQSDDGKIAKVTADETHSNQTTYYECRNVNGTYEWVYASPSKVEGGSTVIDTSHIWNYIGQEGSYYTKGEADNRFVNVDGDTMTGTLTISSTGSIAAASATSVTVPTKAAGTNTTDAASTAFVKTAIDNEDALVVHLSGNETIAGTKTFSTTPVVGTLTAGTSNTSAASTAFVGTAISNADALVVHLAGTETITGNKVFTGNTAPIELDRTGNNFVEITSKSSNKRTGGFRNITDNHNTTLMYVASDDGTSITGYIGVIFDGTNTYAVAPSPTASNATSNNTKIATVEWTNDPTKSTNVVHRTGDESIAGTKTFTGAITATSATVNVKTQARGNSTTLAASTAFVADGLSLKLDTSKMPAISSGTAGQVVACPSSGNSYVWKTVRDITTLAGLDDTTVSSPTNDQSLVYDSTASKWVNKRPTVATISYW